MPIVIRLSQLGDLHDALRIMGYPFEASRRPYVLSKLANETAARVHEPLVTPEWWAKFADSCDLNRDDDSYHYW